MDIHGFLNINKPAGPTSHDIVYGVRRALGRGVKVGHAGTLDPFAQGVLLMCLGGACRLASMVMAQTKRYVTTIALGSRSSTDDRMGEIVAINNVSTPTFETVQRVLEQFTGEIMQVPPAHSAIFVDGQRAYKLARQGQSLDLPARPVTVNSIRVLDYAYPTLKIEVVCGCGTYIRSLARDIGEALGTGGYCVDLIRTASGAFTIDDAVSPENIDLKRDLMPSTIAVAHLPLLTMTVAQTAEIFLGRRVKVTGVEPANEVAILDATGELIALGKIVPPNLLQPTKVLRNTNPPKRSGNPRQEKKHEE